MTGRYDGAPVTPPKRKAYASFDLYLADQKPKNRALIRALRAFVKRAGLTLVESVKWGNGGSSTTSSSACQRARERSV